MAKATSLAKKHLSQDPVFAPLVETIQLEPLNLTNDVYLRLVRAIVYQQLSGKAATTIYGRFTDLFEDGYPHPESVLGLDLPSLRQVGLSRQKATYIQNVAEHFVQNDLLRQDWSKVRDEAVIGELTRIKGVGTWTVQMILMFSLGRKDILPTGDLAIQQSMQQLYELEGTGRTLEHQMLKVAEAWRPYRSVAARYLWRWKDTVV